MQSFLPTSRAEMDARGWDTCDVVIATPDAYVDHPSFAMAILSRFLEAHGYRVGILSQPRWKEPSAFTALGIPRIAFVVSGGNMDSMVLNYTPAKKPRREDLYCEGGVPYFSRPGEGRRYRIRPERVVTVYSSQIRAAAPRTPVIIGGIEASMRRIAHYDWWSDSVRRSVLADAKAHLLIYGMGEYPLLDAVRALEGGSAPDDLEIPGTAVLRHDPGEVPGVVQLPSFEEVGLDREAFAEAFCAFERNRDRHVLFQKQDGRFLVQYPRRDLSPEELDACYDLPFCRAPHPRFRKIPAFEMIRDSITAHRGCYGDCAFCALPAHQGRTIVSRSPASVEAEARAIARSPGFSGTISDVGGPSANMYGSSCAIGGCADRDCAKCGEGCPHLLPGTGDYLALLAGVSRVEGVKQVRVSSGLRVDPVICDGEFLDAFFPYIPGQLKIGLESGSDHVLRIMHKPPTRYFTQFLSKFSEIARRRGMKRYPNPYLIVGHPGEGEGELGQTIRYLEEQGLSGHQFQIFTPTPLTRATAIYYLGYDPCTGDAIEVERDLRVLEERKARLITRDRGRRRDRRSSQWYDRA
ncbi:MAG: YgiQ family radical SAM protein [Methanomicrobiaceae archaeon]|nr:YgiQ family radical SAM protein [Methanomicrobiaceae archaeon]